MIPTRDLDHDSSHFSDGGDSVIPQADDRVFPQQFSQPIPNLVGLVNDFRFQCKYGDHFLFACLSRRRRSKSRPSVSNAESSIWSPLTFTIMK